MKHPANHADIIGDKYSHFGAYLLLLANNKIKKELVKKNLERKW